MISSTGRRFSLAPRSWLLRGALAVVLGCASALAQQVSESHHNDPGIEVLLHRIEQLEASQKQLQEKIDQLTHNVAVPSPEPAPLAARVVENAQAAEKTSATPPVAAPDESEGEGFHTLGPVQFRGFSDFNYGRAWFEKQPEGGLLGSPRSFNIGDFDLFTNTRISEHWSVLGELLITSDFSNEFSAELDRLLFTYKANDYFKIAFGKFNTSLGYYGNAFNRAQYFQTGVGRPIMYADEDNGGILPTHNIGVTATGKIPSGALGLHWVAEVANGSSGNPGSPLQNFVDSNNGKAVNIALYARPDWAHGLQMGFSTYHDMLYPTEMEPINQTIVTAHAAYFGSRFEWLNELSVVRHAMKESPQVFHNIASYTQFGWSFGKTRPYFRFDYQNTAAADPLLGHWGRQSGPSFGVNRHISNFVVLKLQYGRLGKRELPTANAFTGQLAFAF